MSGQPIDAAQRQKIMEQVTLQVELAKLKQIMEVMSKEVVKY